MTAPFELPQCHCFGFQLLESLLMLVLLLLLPHLHRPLLHHQRRHCWVLLRQMQCYCCGAADCWRHRRLASSLHRWQSSASLPGELAQSTLGSLRGRHQLQSCTAACTANCGTCRGITLAAGIALCGGRSGYSPEHMAAAGDNRWSRWIKADGAVCVVPFNKVVCNNLLHILPCHRLVSICTQGAVAATGPQHKLEPGWKQVGLWRCCCVQ